VNPSLEQLETLLALKRDERPQEGYWRNFVVDFHQRQHMDAVERTGLKGMMAKTSDWFGQFGAARWAYGAGMAYACATVIFFVFPREADKVVPAATPVKYEVLPMPATEQLQELDLTPEAKSSDGEQVF
jgi:hypothetical protein